MSLNAGWAFGVMLAILMVPNILAAPVCFPTPTGVPKQKVAMPMMEKIKCILLGILAAIIFLLIRKRIRNLVKVNSQMTNLHYNYLHIFRCKILSEKLNYFFHQATKLKRYQLIL
jgi:hypothetical protein